MIQREPRPSFVIYLLDVNVLLAMAYEAHVHHTLVWTWLDRQRTWHAPSHVKLATCAITELRFIRIASGPTRLAASVREARADLERLKRRQHMVFINDRVLAGELPEWVIKGPPTTDGHLVMLARANGAQLATLDPSIVGAELISQSDPVGPAALDVAMQSRWSY
jgi:predicted nucleic acid-binding protein